MIAFFLFTDLYALAWAGGTGLLATAGWPLIVVALPFALLGVWLGSRLYLRLYLRLDEARLQQLIWSLLAGLGALGLVSAAARLAP